MSTSRRRTVPKESKLWAKAGATPCNPVGRARFYNGRLKHPTCLSMKTLKALRTVDSTGVPATGRSAMAAALLKKYKFDEEWRFGYDFADFGNAGLTRQDKQNLRRAVREEMKPALHSELRRNAWLADSDLEQYAQALTVQSRRSVRL